MRNFAFSLAVVALIAPVSLVSGDDFSALLSDLSFGDEPTLNSPLGVAQEEAADALKPAPGGYVMPDSATVSLHDPVESAPQAVQSDELDLDAAFALQEIESGKVPAQSVGFRGHGCTGRDSGCGCAECQSGCDSDPGVVCIPRTKPVLPSSTLYQYFRSNKCYTNVWDGYRQDCPKSHKHIHGQCDCLNKSRDCGNGCGSVLPACESNGCGSCDSTCD